MIPMSKLNPHKLRIPARVVAKNEAVQLHDLGITIGKEPVNLFQNYSQLKLYHSPNLKMAIEMGLLVKADDKDPDIEAITE